MSIWDDIDRFRERRAFRLMVRMDADDDDEGGSKGGGHGNTRIPFGLCQREGIAIQSGWSPSDAWAALEGKGYSAKAAYKELRESGHVTEKSKTQKPAEPKKMTVDDAKKFLSDYDKKLKELEDKADEAKEAYKKANDSITEDLINEFEKGPDDNDPNSFAKWKEAADKLRSLNDECDKAEKAWKDAVGERDDFIDENAKKTEDAMKIIKYAPTMPMREAMKFVREYDREIKGKERQLSKIHSQIKKNVEKAEALKKRLQFGWNMTPEELNEIKSQFEEIRDSTEALSQERWSIEAELDDYKREHDNGIREAARSLYPDWSDCKDSRAALNRSLGFCDNKPEFTAMMETACNVGVKFNYPSKMDTIPDEDAIIKKVGGGDQTAGGSCASVGIAYIANKFGWDVHDFRGGTSKNLLATQIDDSFADLGGKVVSDYSPLKSANSALSYVEEGKEYYFWTGAHAAIVRKVGGKIQYLELQTQNENGWHDIDNNVLRSRFYCVAGKVQPKSGIVDIKTMYENDTFGALMGIMNTEEDKQKKGAGGYAK